MGNDLKIGRTARGAPAWTTALFCNLGTGPPPVDPRRVSHACRATWRAEFDPGSATRRSSRPPDRGDHRIRHDGSPRRPLHDKFERSSPGSLMESRWNDALASRCRTPLELRVLTSRLLGEEPSLVLHGGGNTSVKVKASNIFGEEEELLQIKGSGSDLATIEASGFATVRPDALRRMAELPRLSDTEMVRVQRAAMTDPGAPTPSVEAILHALIPFTFVDHTHADAVVAVSNTQDGERRIREVYGSSVLVVPYVMPGF